VISTSVKLNIDVCHFTSGCYGYGIIGPIVTMVIRGCCPCGIMVLV